MKLPLIVVGALNLERFAFSLCRLLTTTHSAVVKSFFQQQDNVGKMSPRELGNAIQCALIDNGADTRRFLSSLKMKCKLFRYSSR